jgi:hypothetical protein
MKSMPNETAFYSGPEDRICIALVDLDRKHSNSLVVVVFYSMPLQYPFIRP